jgi:HEAT repeat protein
LLEGAGLASDEGREARAAWLAAIRGAGDPRLVPTLGALVESRERGIALDAARALGRVDTASAHAILASAFRRSNTPADRAVLGGMLGLHGDPTVLPELRDTMRAEDPRARLAAVEAIGPIATSEDFEPLASLLGTGSLALDRAVVRSLGRLGDARAVRLLRGLRATDRGPALSVDVEEALRAVRAQMELRGEKDVPEGALKPVITRAASPWWARALARLHMLAAALEARLGMQARALRRLDRAIESARDLAAPWVAKGRIFMARGSSAEALVVFRRAIEIDRASVERTPLAARAVARAFLERSEATRREGRRDVAQGLLEEALTLDLRRVPLPLRQALAREREKLAREEAP